MLYKEVSDGSMHASVMQGMDDTSPPGDLCKELSDVMLTIIDEGLNVLNKEVSDDSMNACIARNK